MVSTSVLAQDGNLAAFDSLEHIWQPNFKESVDDLVGNSICEHLVL